MTAVDTFFNRARGDDTRGDTRDDIRGGIRGDTIRGGTRPI